MFIYMLPYVEIFINLKICTEFPLINFFFKRKDPDLKNQLEVVAIPVPSQKVQLRGIVENNAVQVRSVAGAPPRAGRIGVPSAGAVPAAGVAAAAGRHPG